MNKAPRKISIRHYGIFPFANKGKGGGPRQAICDLEPDICDVTLNLSSKNDHAACILSLQEVKVILYEKMYC